MPLTSNVRQGFLMLVAMIGAGAWINHQDACINWIHFKENLYSSCIGSKHSYGSEGSRYIVEKKEGYKDLCLHLVTGMPEAWAFSAFGKCLCVHNDGSIRGFMVYFERRRLT